MKTEITQENHRGGKALRTLTGFTFTHKVHEKSDAKRNQISVFPELKILNSQANQEVSCIKLLTPVC